MLMKIIYYVSYVILFYDFIKILVFFSLVITNREWDSCSFVFSVVYIFVLLLLTVE